MGVIMVHIAPHAIDIGIPSMIAASTLSIIGGTSIIGRLAIGSISDRVGSTRALTGCFTMVTLALVCLLLAQETWVFYAFAIVFGLAYGGIITLETTVAAGLFGVRNLGIILASLELFAGIGGAAGGPLAGIIFDVTGEYSLAFLICVILGFLAIILSLFLLRVRIKES